MVKNISIIVQNGKYIVSSEKLSDYILSRKRIIDDNFIKELNKKKEISKFFQIISLLIFLLSIRLLIFFILIKKFVLISISISLIIFGFILFFRNSSQEIKKKNNKVFYKYKKLLRGCYKLIDKTTQRGALV